MINKLIKILFLFLTFKIKYKFSIPPKKKIIVYDAFSLMMAKLFFKHKDFEIFYNRFEEINITVFLISIFKYGLNDLSLNYRKVFFSFVDPKIIFTSIDNNHGFYLLKSKLKKYTFISVQNGMRTLENYKFYQKKVYKNKLPMDYIFTLGKYDLNSMRNIYNSNIYSIGNVFNNFYNIKKKNKKRRKIIYIQQTSLPIKSRYLRVKNYHQEEILKPEIKLIKIIYQYCKINNYDFLIFIKRSNTTKLIQKLTNIKNIKFFCFSSNRKKGYEILDNSKLVVSLFSSLAFESLARGNKTIFFLPSVAFKINKNWFNLKYDFLKKYNLSNYFKIKKLNSDIFEKEVFNILNVPYKYWYKISKKLSMNLMSYDKNNMKIKNVINKIIQ